MTLPALRIAALSALVLLALPVPAEGAGGAPVEAPNPLDEAADLYNQGLSHRDRAWKLEKKAAAAETDEKRRKLETRARKEYQRAAKVLGRATEKDPSLHRAWGSLGYALRKTGDFAAALEAYDQALSLEPDYVEAIEYRGEAYLGLGRIEDAAQAYEALVGRDEKQAATLLAAMKEQAAKWRAEPGAVEPARLEALEEWIAAREEGGKAVERSSSW